MRTGVGQVRWAAGALALLWLVGACTWQQRDRSRVLGSLSVTAQQMGPAWPLTVDKGELICEGYLAAVFRADGVDYALNVEAARQGYADITPLLKRGRNANGLLQTALGLCQ